MELRQLEMLLTVAEGGSYVEAGKRLNISHSAIHRQIRLLENDVRERLLVRVGRNVELTEAGKLLVGLTKSWLPNILFSHFPPEQDSDSRSGKRMARRYARRLRKYRIAQPRLMIFPKRAESARGAGLAHARHLERHAPEQLD